MKIIKKSQIRDLVEKCVKDIIKEMKMNESFTSKTKSKSHKEILQNANIAEIVDVNFYNDDWKEINSDVCKGVDGKEYQVYTSYNEDKGEIAFLIAKYLFQTEKGSQWVSEKTARAILGDRFVDNEINNL